MFTEATSPQQYEFYAGAERFESYKVKNVCLENTHGEFLKVKAIQTCYSDVRITRLPKEVPQPILGKLLGLGLEDYKEALREAS